jgi:hypothetical protein
MREIRPSGSVRGVRSDPYPYRDAASSRCAAALFLVLLASSRAKPEQQRPSSGYWSIPTDRPRPAKPHGCEEQAATGEEKTPAVDSQQSRIVEREASRRPRVQHRPDCQQRRRRTQREARQRRPGAPGLPPASPTYPAHDKNDWQGHISPKDEQDWKDMAHGLCERVTVERRSRRRPAPAFWSGPRSGVSIRPDTAVEHRSGRRCPSRYRQPHQGSPCHGAIRF